MTAVIRQLLNFTLQGMEPGRFQDFCLAFLPLLHDRFEGLERNGHTVSGKTRPGKPDLIKVTPAGAIGVECGTEEEYWTRPKEVNERKPYRDLVSCLDHPCMNNPCELVAISNREIPPSEAAVRSALAELLAQHTKAKITLIPGQRIDQYLWSNCQRAELKWLLREFFPELFIVVHGATPSAAHSRPLADSRSPPLQTRPSSEDSEYTPVGAAGLRVFPPSRDESRSDDASKAMAECKVFRLRIENLLGTLEFDGAAETAGSLATWLDLNGAALPREVLRVCFALLAQVSLSQAARATDDRSKHSHLDRARIYLDRGRDA